MPRKSEDLPRDPVTRWDGRAVECAGLENRSDPQDVPAEAHAQPDVNDTSAQEGASVLASRLALLVQKSPDLALLVERWDTLPEAMRAGMMAMVRAL